MIFKVARLGHPVLRMKARAVSQAQIAEEPFQQLLEELRQTMVEYDGIGIAAPQVHLSLQIALVGEGAGRYPKAPRLKPTVLINPKVRPIGRRKVTDWEGCLSVPGWRGQVPRWHSVAVEAYNGGGQKVCFKASGFFARVIQHEWDHLQGRVYLDRMRGLKTLTHLEEFEKYWDR